MKQWSDNAAQAVGLSKNEYNEFATLVGSQLQNFGMSVDESADKTNELITLGADLSSMFGGTTADVWTRSAPRSRAKWTNREITDDLS